MRGPAVLAFAVALSGCAGHRPAPPPAAGPSVWDFSDAKDPFHRRAGRGGLSARGNAGRAGPASSFGLPPVGGADKAVLEVPAGTGLSLEHHAPPNGSFARDGLVSNYTVVLDVLWPAGSPKGYRAVWQTEPDARDDAEFFVRDGDGAVGVSARYDGASLLGRWHRIAFAVQCGLGEGGTGQIHKYVDGVFVGGQRTPGDAPPCRWALGPKALLLADDDGETADAFVSGLLFTDRFMRMEELAALGGPSPDGPDAPGAAGTPEATVSRRLGLIAHRGASCCAPENTLAALRTAVAAGAESAEVDIRLSADGVAFLRHDPGLERTTDGSGTAGDLTMRRLKGFDAGTWFDPDWRGERIPTLAEALDAVRGRLTLLLDVKSEGMGAAIARALREARVGLDAVRVFRNKDDRAAADFAAHLPGVGILWGEPVDPSDGAAFDALRAEGVTGFDVDIASATAEFVGAAHARGFRVTSYTILNRAELEKAARIGLDGVETDFPAQMRALLP